MVNEEMPIRRWSTADVPQGRRLDYFAAALSEALFPIGLGQADPRSFRADVSAAHLGAIDVCKAIGSPHSGSRGRPELARTSSHCFTILMTLQSSWTADHRGPLRMRPRDVLIIDTAYPSKVALDDAFVAINVTVSETWLRQWIPNPNLLAARRIPGNSLWGLALSSYVSELSPELTSAPPLPLSVIADQVGSLLALTANGLWSSGPELTAPVRSMHERIQDCLLQRCMEPQLTAAEIAGSMDISVRTLHRIFAAASETFGSKLIEARISVALRMLTSPLFRRVTTAEVGRRAGFLSSSHFARVIRSHTGRTPMQLRHAALSDGFEHEVFGSDHTSGNQTA